MHIQTFLEEKREGQEHSAADIQAFIKGVVDGSITRAQAAAWLAFVNVRGMSDRETTTLTQAMTDSGRVLAWPGLSGPFVDKHSTGGVGDKISLILAPVWAAMGMRVPMISGRGLGITGGTLDKLEAIDGYRTTLSPEELRLVLAEAGCFINGQTGELAPADRFLYALRDETATVPSIPLITASILSKKLAEGLDRLVLDVKCGSGAFMRTRTSARKLADSLVRVGRSAGLQVESVISDMSQPLGLAVGNAVEVQESIDVLKGGGPDDVRKLVLSLSGDPEAAKVVIRDGSAYERFERMVHAQGGDLAKPLLGGKVQEEVVLAGRSGRVERCDALGIGQAAFLLGAGRVKASDDVHPGVGVLLTAKRGDMVEAGQPLARLLHAEGHGLHDALDEVRSAIEIKEI
ncbi:MAG: thymidine phosphorylase [Myxococcota bacterium]|nr:thymidine phosphorylase [Myxococcota bacterium]